MLKRPLPKLVGLVSAGASYVTGQNHDAIRNFFDNFMPVMLADGVAHVVFGVCIIVVYFSHAGNGTGGSESVHTKPSLTSNMMSR